MRTVLIRSLGLLTVVAAVMALATPSHAFPVDGAFGAMPKAIYFTGTAVPTDAKTLGIADGVASGGTYETTESGIVMIPVGDGSWVCTATVYRGATYNYKFEWRVPRYGETSDSFYATGTEPGGTRNNDYTRTVTIPNTAAAGYYIYNTLLDYTVRGFQGTDTTVYTTANPYLAQWRGTDDIDGTSDNDSGDVDGDNIYGVDAVQTGDSQFTISWSFNPGNEIAPHVAGDLIFDTDDGFPDYGYRILRAPDTSSGGFNNVVFQDITTNISVRGDTNYAETGASWPSVTLTAVDTQVPNSPDTYIYTVVFFSAYRFVHDTTSQNFGGGYDTAIRQAAIKVFFIVEQMDPNVVFGDDNKGWVWVTPYIDGVRRIDLKQRVPVVRVTARSRPVV